MASFEVFVDDNFHFMDEGERYSAGRFYTYEDAVAKAKSIVDKCLKTYYKPGMTSESLCKGYKMYGEDPFIVGDLGVDVIDETLERANAIIKEMESRQMDGNSFEEMIKPMNLPESKVRFSAWDYAEKRCKELCEDKV
jgi:protein associated with RNAse G/E